MIAKAVKGTGFRGALAYDLAPEKGELLDTNLAGETPRELAAEFGAIRDLRPTLGKAVLHVSLTAAPGEQLSDDQWREIGQRYLAGMGFSEHQYVLTRHTDTEHDHIHLVANRIGYDGQVVSDSHDYPRQEQLMREIEREYGLQEVAPSAEAARHAPTKGELERTLRTGEPSTRHQLQVLCDDAAQGCHSFTAYAERLDAVGVAITPTVQRDGAVLSGLQYRLDGVTMKGSDLGKAYAAAGIQKRGISYEQDRDSAAVERCRARAADRGDHAPDRDRAVDPGREAGRAAPAPGGASMAQPVGAERPAGAGETARAVGSREAAAKPEETQAPPHAPPPASPAPTPAPAQEAPGVPAPPRRSVEEVARDPDIPQRIAQSPDPAQRAEAQTLTPAEEQPAAPAERPAEERDKGREPESRESRTEAGTPAEARDQGREPESQAGRTEAGRPAEEQPAAPAERPAEEPDQGREPESRESRTEAGTPAEEQPTELAERPAEEPDQGREPESQAGRTEAGTAAEEQPTELAERPAEEPDQGREPESQAGRTEAGTAAEEQPTELAERPAEEPDQGRDQDAPGGAQVSAVSPPSPSRWETIKATAGAWVERVTGRVSTARPEEIQAPPAAQVAAPHPPPPAPAAAPVGSPHESLYDAFAEEIPPERKPAAQVAPPPTPAPAQVSRAPEASPAPRPSAEEVARDPDIPKRIAQIQDPVQRAEAETLLKEVRAEVAARARSNQPSKGKDEGPEL